MVRSKGHDCLFVLTCKLLAQLSMFATHMTAPMSMPCAAFKPACHCTWCVLAICMW